MALSMFGASTTVSAPADTSHHLSSKKEGAPAGRGQHIMKTETESHTATPDSTISPPPLLDSSPESRAAAMAAAAAAFSAGLTHPLLSSPHAAALLRASAAATQTAALIGLQSLGLPHGLSPGGTGPASGVPVHLHATLASSPALFQHGALFNWSKLAAVHPAPVTNAPVPTPTPKKQRKVTTRRAKSKPPEPELITQLDSTSEPPLSPPTSGSSPPSTTGEPGVKAISSGGSSAGEPVAGKDGSSGRDKVFECRICNRCFGYKHVLQNHERTHTGEKPFACGECNKRFTRDHHLKTHMRLHTGEKPYKCTHCDRQFVQVANLRRHLRVHTGERPYQCPSCDSKFSDSNQLKAHVLIHKGEKPFKCGRCSGRFRRRHHLMHHKCPEGGVRGPQDDEMMDELLDDDEEMLTAADGDIEDEDDLSAFLVAPSKKRDRKPRETRRVIRVPPASSVSPLPSPPEESLVPRRPCLLPEQTEPEDLSMSTMLNNNNTILHVSGNGIARRLQSRRTSLTSSDEDLNEEELHRRSKLQMTPAPVSPAAAAAFLAHRHPKFRRHLSTDAAATPAPPAAIS